MISCERLWPTRLGLSNFFIFYSYIQRVFLYVSYQFFSLFFYHFELLSICLFLLHSWLDPIASLFFLSLLSVLAPLPLMPWSFTCSTIFRLRWFITQPCFSWACAQKLCVRGWAWYRSLICRSQAKGWVITACKPLLDRTVGGQHFGSLSFLEQGFFNGRVYKK